MLNEPGYSLIVTTRENHLKLRLTGGPADAHRISLVDLTTVAQGVQAAVRNVGAVLAGQSTGRGGRKLGWIEQATELELVASPSEGSVVLDLELAEAAPTLDIESEIEDLGSEALSTFVDGIGRLSTNGPLPRGFDPGVLKALTSLSPVFSKGYRGLELTVGSNGFSRRSEISADRIGIVRQITKRPISAPASIDGVLIAVDLAGDPLTCRIDRPFLPSVTCLIPREMREVVKGLIEHQVHAEGAGEFDPGSEQPKRLDVHDLIGTDASAIDRLAWRDHRPWQEHALQQGAKPLKTEDLPNLFEDDEDLERFLAAAHGMTSN
jgi:hypothetical protein